MFENAVRAFTVAGKVKPEEAVVATLSSLPDEVVDTVGTVLPFEDSVSERRRTIVYMAMSSGASRISLSINYLVCESYSSKELLRSV